MAAVLKKEARQTLEDFSQRWMGNNLTKEGFDRAVKELKSTLPAAIGEEEGPSPEEVANNWRKLAALQRMT